MSKESIDIVRKIFADIKEALYDNKINPSVGEDFEPHYLIELEADITELEKKYMEEIKK
jgi:hypothetical protein